MKTREEKKMTGNAPMYLFATEMVSLYYEKLHLDNKSVLTITGSGDQVFNAFFYGAREVHGFDINENSLFITELKHKAIQNMAYEDFLAFFSFEEDSFSYAIYSSFRNQLTKECREYLDALYEKCSDTPLSHSEHFRRREFFAEDATIKDINVYLRNAENYTKLQNILKTKTLKLFIGDIVNIQNNIEIAHKKFDVINLSNVPNYLTGKTFSMEENAVLKVFLNISKLLDDKGVLFYCSYDNKIYPNPIAQVTPPISRETFLALLKKLKGFSVSQEFFPGLHKGQTDRITLMQKIK